MGTTGDKREHEEASANNRECAGTTANEWEHQVGSKNKNSGEGGDNIKQGKTTGKERE